MFQFSINMRMTFVCTEVTFNFTMRCHSFSYLHLFEFRFINLPKAILHMEWMCHMATAATSKSWFSKSPQIMVIILLYEKVEYLNLVRLKLVGRYCPQWKHCLQKLPLQVIIVVLFLDALKLGTKTE